jgi:predicted nucleotidyltransferase
MESLAQKLSALLADAPREVVAAYLYGSQARGTAGAGSDVDVGILLSAPARPTLQSVERELEARIEAVTGRPSQVVLLNGASSDLVHRVLRDGVVLLDRDRPARIRFEVQARNDYFDMEPIRRRYRRAPA